MLVPPASNDANLINNLFFVVYVFSFIVFVLVEALLVIAAIRFRRRRADEMPEQIHGHSVAELTWTVVPAVVVAIVFAFSVDTLSRLSAAGPASNPVNHVHAIGDTVAAGRADRAQKVDLVIKVVGRQWLWQYTYPDTNVSFSSISSATGRDDAGSSEGRELVIPAGRTVRLDLTAADVIHAWWVPAFGPMLYVNPGEVSYVWINALPGEYVGQCNVFCGVAHPLMISRVKVLPAADWDEWYRAQVAASSGPAQPGDAKRGFDTFMNGPCIACHLIEGTKAQGTISPRALTRYASAYPTIAQVGTLALNKDNLEKWLKNPPALKPGTAMPNLNLKPQEIADLTEYLLSLK